MKAGNLVRMGAILSSCAAIVLIFLYKSLKLDGTQVRYYPMHGCADEVVWPTARVNKLPPNLNEMEMNITKNINCVPVRLHTGANGLIQWEMCLYDGSADRVISQQLRKGNVYEEHDAKYMAMALNVCPDCGLFDIGANLGVYSLLAAKMGHSVISVEPRPETILRLRKAITKNKFGSKTVVLHNAVSDIRTTMHLMSEKTNPGNTWLACRDQCNDDKKNFCTGEKVDTIYLDDLIPLVQSLNIKRAIMKMDIQGSEVDALAQSAMLFKTVDIRIILMEWVIRKEDKSDTGKAKTQGLVDTMHERGFKPVKVGTLTELPRDWTRWPYNVCWIKGY